MLLALSFLIVGIILIVIASGLVFLSENMQPEGFFLEIGAVIICGVGLLVTCSEVKTPCTFRTVSIPNKIIAIVDDHTVYESTYIEDYNTWSKAKTGFIIHGYNIFGWEIEYKFKVN